MKVSCEHTPLLTTGLTAVPVQPRIPHLANLFPCLIPFHTFLPNFPFQCSFPTPHLPSKFLFFSFTLFIYYHPGPFRPLASPKFLLSPLSGIALQLPSLRCCPWHTGSCHPHRALSCRLAGVFSLLSPLLSHPSITGWLSAMPKQLVAGIAGKSPIKLL